MKKILFPTDFSETANNAFVYALEMSKSLQSELIVLHVYDLPVVSYEGYSASIIDVYESIELNKFENFKDYIPKLREIAESHNLGSIKMSHVLEYGDLIPSINKLVKQENIDLIVMGTNGASGLKEVFLGSNTGSVISNVPVTLLCVPEKAKFKKIEKIGFTTRYQDKDRVALKQVLAFAKRIKASVKCLYVKTFNSDVNADDIEKWKQEFKTEPLNFFIFSQDEKEDTVIEFIDNQNIDILAMLTYKRTFFESLFKKSFAKELSYHTEIPLLVLHEA
jgi:nucleotide-binding universal stress UspA family protein